MSTGKAIQYVLHSGIDRAKWDRCIRNAANGAIYGYSFYLDQMAPQWDALILGDYDTVMPLTWKKKWGIRYLYQPPFTASLGVFGNHTDQTTVALFLKAIPHGYKLVEIELNAGNTPSAPYEGMTTRTNLILPLNKSYEAIRQAYRENTRRECGKAFTMGCSCRRNVPVKEIIEIAKKQMGLWNAPHRKGLDSLELLFTTLEKKEMAKSYGLYASNGKLLAGALFFFSHKRAYYILAANTPESRGFKSSHCIIDQFIQDHANSECTLDFEGSDVPGIAFFYRSFGAEPEHYPGIRINRLPIPLRWLKK